MCSRTDRNAAFSAKYVGINKATGLSKNAIIAARKELVRLALIQADLDPGRAGRYYFTVMNAQRSFFPLDWNRRPWPRYFRVPETSMLCTIYPKNWTGTDALVYDTLCDVMGRTGQNELPRTEKHWFKSVTKNTLRTCETHLTETGFIRVKDTTIEVLHPDTSESMPVKCWDQDASERTYYMDDNGFRRLFSEEQLTPDTVERYFRKSLPRAAEWVPGRDAHCPFHDDQTPSLSINAETGQWCCHACDIGGHKLVSFEMRLLDTEDVHTAWKSVAKKIGVRVAPQGRGKATHRHEYRDAQGVPYYQVLRYEDGTASYRRYEAGLWKPKLGNRKRILYNLPEVIAADVVVIVEGEKKADVLRDLGLLDGNGKPVAITATGGASSWRTEFVEHLIGKRVLLLPDADDAGIRYCDSVEASLTRMGIEYQTVYFNEFGKDIRDFLKDHTRDELIAKIDSPWLGSVMPVGALEGEITI